MSLERKDKKLPEKKKKRDIILESEVIKETQSPRLILDRKENKIKQKFSSFDRLSEIEKEVLKIAQEVFKQKKHSSKFQIEDKSDLERYPIIRQLYSKCVSELHYRKGYNKEEIFLAIRSLEKESWIVSEGRRTKLEILNNIEYQEIIDFIRKNPGIHALDNKVEKELGITRSPFIKRIITLLRYEIIREHKIGKVVHFFLVDTPKHYDELKAFFLNPIIPKIIKVISKDIYISGIQLANVLNEPVHKIHYYLKKIKDLNIIKKTKGRIGRECYWINEDLLSDYNTVFTEPHFIT